MKKAIIALISFVAFTANTCSTFALENYNDIVNAGGNGNSKMSLTVENTGAGDNVVFSAWVPSELPITMDLDGNIVVPSNARIINGVDTKGIKVTDLSVTTKNGWTLAGFNEDFESKEDNLKEIGLKFRGDRVGTNGTCLLTADKWMIPKASYIDLEMQARIPKQTVHGERDEISTVSFTLDWSGDDTTVGPEVPSGSLEINFVDGEHGTIVDKNSLYTDEYGKIISLPDVEPDEGYELLEWRNVVTGEEVKYGDIIYTEIVIQPIFIESTASLPENKIRIIFQAGEGGSIIGENITATKGITFGQLRQPSITPNNGYKFIGWFIGDEAITDDYVIDSNTTITATFKLDETAYEYFTYTIDNDEVTITGLSNIYKEATESSTTRQSVPSDLIIPSSINGKTVVAIGAGAFFGDSYITSIKMPDTITTIDDFTFTSCSRLTNIDISPNVQVIGHSFCSQTALGSINIPDSVIEIGDGAFSGCTKLSTINFGANVRDIGIGTFEDCSSLKSVNIPDSVETLGKFAFSNCGLTTVNIGKGLRSTDFGTLSENVSLTSLVVDDENPNYESIENVLYSKDNKVLVIVPGGIQGIYNILDNTEEIYQTALFRHTKVSGVNVPDSMKKVGVSAFEGTTKIKVVEFPETLEELGISCFESSNLTSIHIPSNVTVIPDTCFKDCILLTTAELHDDITDIGYKSFYNCNRLINICIGNNMENIGDYAFAKCLSINRIDIDAINCIVGSYSFSESGIVYGNIKAKEILNYTFRNCDKMLESSIYSIECPGTGVYSNCDVLKKVRYETPCETGETETGHKTISNYTFDFCNALEDVELIAPNRSLGVAYVDNKRVELEFRSCNKLKNLKLELDLIDDEMFYNRDSIETLDIKCNIIDPNAFRYCDGITNAVIDAKTVNNSAFSECTGLNEVYLSNCTNLGTYVFNNCTSLTKVVFDNVEKTAYMMFNQCYALNDVQLGSAMKKIGEYSFRKCTNLKSIEFPDTLEEFDNYAMAYSGLESVTIPDSISTLRYGAFRNCDNLATVNIGRYVTYIQEYCFYKCTNLTKVHSYNSISTIGDYAFGYCTSLNPLVIGPTFCYGGNYSFYKVPKLVWKGLYSVNGAPWGAASWEEGNYSDYSEYITFEHPSGE